MNLDNLIVEPNELHTAIQAGLDSNICIVDLSGEENYRQGHVPGAIYLPFQSLLSGQAPVPGKIASKAQLEGVFSYLGLDEKTHFIVYDDEGGGWAGRFIWTLDIIGHKHYSYLNGGIHAWRQEGFACEHKENTRTAKDVNIELNEALIVEIPSIMEGITHKNITIWDARSPQEYSGERVSAAKSGHIPGAINCEWTRLMDANQGLKIKTNAREILSGLGINGDKPIVTHCQSHHRSGFTYLVGKTLGFDIRAYHGSWSEWGNHPETPVEV